MHGPLNVKLRVSIRTDMMTVCKTPRYNSTAEMSMHWARTQVSFRWGQREGAGVR